MESQFARKAFAVGAFVSVATFAAPSALGQFQSATVPGYAEFLLGDQPTVGDTPLLGGDTVDVAVTGFNANNAGAFLSGPASHTVGTMSTIPSAAAGLIPDHFITTSVMTVGTTRTLTIQIDAGGPTTALAPSTLSLDGLPVVSLFFEIPDFNAGPDLFDDPQKIGAASGTFDLLGTNFASLFTTTAGINDMGASFSVGNGVSAGGANIFDPMAVGDILTGGAWTISYQVVPAPSAAALLALAGLTATRRRRG